MRISRRLLLGTGAAALGLAFTSTPARLLASPRPARLSLPEFSKNDKLVAALRRGVAKMRSRSASDPTSWFWQASVHAVGEDMLKAEIHRDPSVTAVDAEKYWNQCPHFGQSSADFLIWHRAYLYYFERILRAAAEEPELAIPFWNYHEPEGLSFPGLFKDEFLDEAKKVPNPLYHPEREMAFVTGRFTLSNMVSSAEKARACRQFFSSPGVNGFGGDIRAEEDTVAGELERRPHNDLHVAVGGRVGTTQGAMADVPTAAFDPIFWTHHANVERMWREWAASPESDWGPLPPDEWLDERPWVFVDHDGSEHRLPRRFYLDQENIDVGYAGERIARTLKLPPKGRTLRKAASFRTAGSVVHRQSRGFTLGGSEQRAAFPLALPRKRLRNRLARPAAAEGGQSLLLRLRDIGLDQAPGSGFNLFLAPKGAALDLASPYYLGNLSLFGLGKSASHRAGHQGHSPAQSFDITAAVRHAGSHELELVVQRYSLYASRGRVVPPGVEALRVGTIEIRLV